MKKMMLLALLLLGGCSQFQLFENRIACAMDLEQAYYVSMYMRLGVASQIAKADAIEICKRKQ